ncbi:MAG: hypothetical protein HZB62_10780 [Nitrospirae bacterium]|nr:hypothetical protein [Nitrospirota bacterium]
MSEALIRTQIFTILSGVTDIGKVYDYERWSADWGAFISLFKSTVGSKDQIRGCEIARRAAPGGYDSNAEELIRHQYVIRMYMSLSDADATEKTFNALIEAVKSAFRFNFQLNDTCESAGPVSADIIEPRFFGSVLCHYAELSLPVIEMVTN